LRDRGFNTVPVGGKKKCVKVSDKRHVRVWAIDVCGRTQDDGRESHGNKYP